MKGWMALVLALSTIALVPSGEAHACNGHDCGPCVKGEQHHHNDWVRGQCSSSASWQAENGWKGQRADVPAGGALLGIAAVGLAALAARRA